MLILMPVVVAMVTALVVAWAVLGSDRFIHVAAASALWLMAIMSMVTAVGTPRITAIDFTSQTAGWATVVRHGISVAVTVIAVLVLVLSVLRRQRPGLTSVGLGFAVFAGVGVVAGVFATSPSFPAIEFAVPALALGVLYAPGFDVQASIACLRLIGRFYVWGSVASILVNYSWAFSVGAQVQQRTFFGLPQLFGLSTQPNGLGAAAATALVLEASSSSRRLWDRLHFMAAGMVLVLSQSRTGLIAGLLGVAVMKDIGSRVIRRVLLWLAVGAGAAVVIVPSFGLAVQTILGSNDVATLNRRTFVWQFTLEEFHRNPLFGYGPGLFDAQYRDSVLGAQFAFIGQAHDQFFQTLGQSGLLGVSALLVYLAILVLAARVAAPVAGGLPIGLVVVLLVRCVTESPLLHRSLDVGVVWHIGTLLVVTAAYREATRASVRSSRVAYSTVPLVSRLPRNRRLPMVAPLTCDGGIAGTSAARLSPTLSR